MFKRLQFGLKFLNDLAEGGGLKPPQFPLVAPLIQFKKKKDSILNFHYIISKKQDFSEKRFSISKFLSIIQFNAARANFKKTD